MGKTKVRVWCEKIGKEFGCTLTHSGTEWAIIQKTAGGPKIVFRSKYLFEVQKYYLARIERYMGERTHVVPVEFIDKKMRKMGRDPKTGIK